MLNIKFHILSYISQKATFLYIFFIILLYIYSSIRQYINIFYIFSIFFGWGCLRWSYQSSRPNSCSSIYVLYPHLLVIILCDKHLTTPVLLVDPTLNFHCPLWMLCRCIRPPGGSFSGTHTAPSYHMTSHLFARQWIAVWHSSREPSQWTFTVATSPGKYSLKYSCTHRSELIMAVGSLCWTVFCPVRVLGVSICHTRSHTGCLRTCSSWEERSIRERRAPLVCRLERLPQAPVGPFVVASWGGLWGSELSVMRDLKRGTNSCHESRRACIPLLHSQLKRPLNVVCEDDRHYHSLWAWRQKEDILCAHTNPSALLIFRCLAVAYSPPPEVLVWACGDFNTANS